MTNYYNYKKTTKEDVTVDNVQLGGIYNLHQYTIKNKSGFQTGQEVIAIDHFESQKKNAPTVVLHPVLRGDNKLMKAYAYYFTLFHGWNAVIIHRGEYPFTAQTPQGFEQRLANAVASNMQVYDWMVEEEIIDPEKTVSIGASMGGMLNAALAGTVPYKGFVCIAAGAPVIKVMMNSNLELFEDWKSRQMIRYNWDRTDLYFNYKKNIKTDPMDFAPDAPSKKVFTINAMFDKVVPTDYQNNLSSHFGKGLSREWWIPLNHTGTLVASVFILPFIWYWARKKIKKG